MAGFVLFGRAFRGSFFLVVLFVVRSSGRAFGRSFCGSFFWSFFWFVLLVVLLVVRALGSCFWFVLLGARMCFLFDALKFLEACVARSEVS